MNYRVTVKSGETKTESVQEFGSVVESLDYIRSVATVQGWRNFTLETTGDCVAGIPLKPKGVEHASV